MTLAEYIKLIDDLLLDSKTTGANQSEELFSYGKLNRQRMHRLEKTAALNDSLKTVVKSGRRRMVWLILTEGWCGDAAQNIPIIEKIASESIKIETRYLLRDENLELMDRFGLAGAATLIPIDADGRAPVDAELLRLVA